jgi:hypothetical protein
MRNFSKVCAVLGMFTCMSILSGCESGGKCSNCTPTPSPSASPSPSVTPSPTPSVSPTPSSSPSTPTPSPTPTAQSQAVISISAPGQYPSGAASVTAYVSVTNSSNFDASGLTFTTTNNNTGTTLTLTDNGGSGNECNTVAANTTCSLPVVVGANSNAGGFTVVLQGASTSSNFMLKLVKKVFTSAKADSSGEFTATSTTANIGLTGVSNSTNSVNGVTLLVPASVQANSTSTTPVGIVATVGANVENFDQIYLTDSTGTALDFQQVPGTSLSGGAGSILTFNVNIPNDAPSPYNIYVKLKKTDGTFDQGTTPSAIRLTADIVPILVSYPSAMDLNSIQAMMLMPIPGVGGGLPIMYSNVGSVPIVNLQITPTAPLSEGTLPTMPTPSPGMPTPPTSCVSGGTLAVGASCMFVAADTTINPFSISSFNAGLTATYTGGQLVTPISVSGSSGILVGTNGFPPFHFTISTGSSQATQIMLTNTSTSSSATSVNFTLPSDFTLSNGLPAGGTGSGSIPSCTLTSGTAIADLAASSSCTLTLTYAASSVQIPTTNSMTIHYTDNGSHAVSVPLTYSAQVQ